MFTKDNGQPPDMQNRCDQDLVFDSIPLDIVRENLRKLNTKKSIGFDGVHPFVLKECAKILSVPLHFIFNKSLLSGQVPKIWKLANISPLFKKGSKLLASNYRPVSLTSIPCKILEKILGEIITSHLEKYNLITKSQHGFVKKRNCITNLLETVDLLTYGLANDKSFDILYTDFAKAFDKVSHSRLLVKLKAYGINGLLLNWIKDFLADRKQRIVMGDCMSEWSNVDSGVPQGSVLGPISFVIYINDLPDQVKNSVCKLYADDNKLISEIRNNEDCFKLQNDIDELDKWSEKWLLGFNFDKCRIMHIGKKNPNFIYHMNSDGLRKPLLITSLEKDVGVLISSDLKWKDQVNACVNKANAILGKFSKFFTYKGKKVMKSLYCTFVRPILDFAVQVWSPYLNDDIEKIERVQRRATKIIPELRHLNYEERLVKLNLTTLSTRRARGDIIQFFKFNKEIDHIDWHYPPKSASSMGTLGPASSIRGHKRRIIREKIRNCAQRHNFFFNRIANTWNSLPTEIVEASSVNSLKAKLDMYFKL